MARTKGKKGEWISGKLRGKFAQYEKRLLTEDLDPKSIYRYRGCLLMYQKWLREEGMEPEPETARLFIASLRRQGYSSASQHLYYVALRKLLHFLGYSEGDTKLKLRREKRLPPYYSSADMEAVLQAHNDNPKMHQALFMCFCYAGLRVSEVLKLTVADVKLELKQPILRIHGKGRKDRNVPIHSRLRPILAEIIQGNKPKERVFPWRSQKPVWTIIHCMGKRAGFDEFHPHSLRHFFGTQLSERGVPLRQIQELMGHESIETTAIYVQVAPISLSEAIETISLGEKEASLASSASAQAHPMGVLSMTAPVQIQLLPGQN